MLDPPRSVSSIASLRCTASTCSPASRAACSPRWRKPPSRCALRPATCSSRRARSRRTSSPSSMAAFVCIVVTRRSSSWDPGTTVGELAALVPQPRTASVTAMEPTLVLRLDKAVLDDLLADWPELAHGVIAALVTRLRAIADHADRGAVSSTPPRGVVGLLTAQALAFGVTLALLIIPANALFLDAYGSEWLPATYIAIAVVGTAASALIARAARRTRLVRVATVSLGALAALYRRVLGDPRRGRRLGVGGTPRPVPDRAPARVRVHRRAGGPAARRSPDEGAVPAGRIGIRRRVLPRRPAGHTRCSRCSARPSNCCSPRLRRSLRFSGSCS